MTLALRDYQQAAIEATRLAWGRGDLAVLGQAATGLGKTVLGIGLLRAEMLDDGRVPEGRRAIWIAHREELLTQPLEAMRRWFPEARTGLVKAGYREYHADLVVASVQSLHRGRLHELPAYDFAIVDEAHHAVLHTERWETAEGREEKATGEPARLDRGDPLGIGRSGVEARRHVAGNTYGALLTHLRRLNPAMRVLGLTATPARTDDTGLGGCFPGRFGPDGLPAKDVRHGVPAFSYDIAYGIGHGWLSPVRSLRIETGTSLEGVHVRHGDFVQGELATAVNTSARNGLVVEAWLEHGKGRPTIAFAVDVGDLDEQDGHVFALRDAFRDAGVRAEAVYGAMPTDERRDVLDRYKRGDIEVLVNCAVLTEGFDAPETACILLARPTKSVGLLTQMVGRGTRTADGKMDCLVIDCVDAARTTGGIRTLLDLGIPGVIDHLTGEDLAAQACRRPGCAEPRPEEWDGYCSEVCQSLAAAAAMKQLPLDDLGRVDWVAVEFDLFTGDIAWGRVGQSRVLGLGGEDKRTVVVFPSDGGWEACVTDGKKGTVDWLTFGPEGEYEALAAAERVVRRSGCHGRFPTRAANGWYQRQDATEKQANALQRFGFGDEVTRWSRAQAAIVLDWCWSRQVMAEARLGHRLDPWRRRRFATDYAEASKVRARGVA